MASPYFGYDDHHADVDRADPASVEARAPTRISAIAAGFLIDVIGSIGFASVAGVCMSFFLSTAGVAPADIAARVIEIGETTGSLVFFLVVGLTGTFVGGYVAGRMGRPASLRHAGLMGGASLVFGIVMAGGGTPNVPGWYTILGYVATLPAALLGGWRATRPTRRS